MDKIDSMDKAALATVSALASKASLLEFNINDLEQKLSETKREFVRITEEALPEAMLELGLTSITLDDGSSIKVADIVHCGIPEAQRIAAFAYLREHELGDVIKNEVTATFGRDEDTKATALREQLSLLGYRYKQKESVHPSTLKALAKEKITAGDPLPEDLFGVHIVTRATIKRG